jgi:hypothetical protein
MATLYFFIWWIKTVINFYLSFNYYERVTQMNPIHSKSFKLSERKQNGKKVLTYPAKENGEKSLAVFLVKRKRNDEVVIFNRRQMERCFGIGFNLFPRGLKNWETGGNSKRRCSDVGRSLANGWQSTTRQLRCFVALK